MTATQAGGDVRGFYAALGVQLPGWAQTEASVRCFANPDAHQHQDHAPSCSVNVHSGTFNCHGCGAHGGAYDAALAKGLSPRDAIDLMIAHALTQRRSGRRPPRRRRTTDYPESRPRATPAPPSAKPPVRCAVTGEQVRAWAVALSESDKLLARLRMGRGWDAQTLRTLQVGFDGERITVPIPDEHDGLQGLLRLRLDPRQDPKVLAAPGTQLGLIPRPRPGQAHVWLVEGPSDMLAARSAGLPAIAVPGTHAWRPEWARHFAGGWVTVVMDADRPGRQAAGRIAGDLERQGAADVRIVELASDRDDGYDLSDWLRADTTPRSRTARTYTTGQYRRILDTGDPHAAARGGTVAGRPSPPPTATPAAIAGATRSTTCTRF